MNKRLWLLISLLTVFFVCAISIDIKIFLWMLLTKGEQYPEVGLMEIVAITLMIFFGIVFVVNHVCEDIEYKNRERYD